MSLVGRRKPFDAQSIERQLTTAVIGFELAIDSFALLMAIASPVFGLLISACAAAWVLLWSQSRFRRITISSSYVIPRSPEVVFAFVSDFRNLPKYYPDVESVEMLTTPPIGPGTQFRTHARLPDGREGVGVEQIVEYNPNRRFTSRAPFLPRPTLDEQTFEPVDGGTHVTHRFDHELSLASAMLGGRWYRLAAAKRFLLSRREAGQTRMKQLLESGQLDG